jgi:hypothetical protein
MAWLSNQAVDWRLSARALFRLEAALLGVACFSASAVPRLLPILLGLLGLVAAIHVFTTDRSPLFKLLRRPFSIGLFVFLGYVFINTMWSPDRVAALLKAATVLGLAAATLLIAASYALRSDREARVLAKSALAGLLLGIAFLLIELSFGEPIARFLNNHVIQLFNVSPKKTKIVEGEVTKIAAFVLNRNVTSLVLLLIPGILFTAAVATTTARRVSLGVLVGATAVAVLLSESGTSVVAFFAGGLVLALSALSLKVTRTVLIVGWTIATLLAVPLGALPYELGWHHWTWLPPESVAARFYIWKYVADPCQRDQSRGSASAARARFISPFRPTRAIRATPNMHCGDAWRAIRTTSISKPGSSSAPSAPCCCLSSGSPRSGRCASCRPRSREAPMRCSRSQA